MLVLLKKVQSAINAASMFLQSKDVDLLSDTHFLKTAFADMSAYRNKFKTPSKKQQEFAGFGALDG